MGWTPSLTSVDLCLVVCVRASAFVCPTLMAVKQDSLGLCGVSWEDKHIQMS